MINGPNAIPPKDIFKDHSLIYWAGLNNSPIEIANCQVFCTNAPIVWLNGVDSNNFITDEETIVVDKVEKILAFFRNRNNVPFTWWIKADKEPPSLAKILKQRKVVSLEESMGMILDLKELSKMNPPDLLKIVEVSTKEETKEMIAVLLDAFKESKNEGEFVENLFWQAIAPKKVLHFIGKINGKPVTAGSLFIDQKVARIFHVGTIGEAQNKNYGSYLIYVMLEKAKSLGCDISAVMAPLKGLNLFKRLGYVEIGIFQRYMTK